MTGVLPTPAWQWIPHHTLLVCIHLSATDLACPVEQVWGVQPGHMSAGIVAVSGLDSADNCLAEAAGAQGGSGAPRRLLLQEPDTDATGSITVGYSITQGSQVALPLTVFPRDHRTSSS